MMDYISNHAGLIGLIFFFSFFVGVLIWVMRPGQKQDFEDHSQIPLKDGDENER